MLRQTRPSFSPAPAAASRDTLAFSVRSALPPGARLGYEWAATTHFWIRLLPSQDPMTQRNIDRLLEIMARLRDPERGCAWDVQQSFATIAPYTIEEAYEVADAIERADLAALRDELGDLLLQVVFHARIAEEARAFDFDAVAGAIADKMIRRHPHVFGEEARPDVAGQRACLRRSEASASRRQAAWETHKAAERAARTSDASETALAGASALDGIAAALPALTRALKLQRRAARVGFDWSALAPILDKIDEEIRELEAEIDQEAPAGRLADELGDLLFSIVNLARRLELDPEAALRQANAKFERRFRRVEALLAARDKAPTQATLAEMDALWDQAKLEEESSKAS